MTNEDFLRSISQEGEEWRDVVGWENLYAVSSMGRVASIATTFNYKSGHVRKKKPLLLKLFKKVGYPFVNLKSSGNVRPEFVHRLIAQAFIPNPNNYPQIDHIDTNTTNNNVNNLRWCNGSMNMSNPKTRQRMSENTSLRNWMQEHSKKKEVVRIDEDSNITIYESTRDAGRNGFDSSTICRCCNGFRKTHKGFQWMYLSDYENLKSTMSKNSLEDRDD